MKTNQIEIYFFYALLAAVIIITLIIFIASSLVWYNFMRKDKTKPVYENIIDQFKKDKK